ncbi:MAG: hypothetical protein R3Y26_00625 [Rikenellaceae bacterium]
MILLSASVLFCGHTFAAEESLSCIGGNKEQVSKDSVSFVTSKLEEQIQKDTLISETDNSLNELGRKEFLKNRGLVEMSTKFVPKGQWIVGATGSYSTHDNDEYSLFIVDGINSQGYSVNISPTVAYVFKENLAAGLRFNYSRSLLRIDDANLTIGGDDGTEIVVNDFYALEHSYTASAIVRQYVPLGRAKRFAFFVDGELEGGGFQSKFANDEPVHGTFSRGYSLGIGLSPGIAAFATNNVAIEVTVGMLGANFIHMDQAHNQVYAGELNYSSLNFKINLLTIGLGFSIYL